MFFEKRQSRDFDKTLLFVTLAIFIIGLSTIYSATQARDMAFAESFILRQMNSFIIALVVLVLCIRVSYQKFVDLAYVFFVVNIVLLVLVLLLGRARLGAQRWFSLGSFAFQPSEFIKIVLILALANYIGGRKNTMGPAARLVPPMILLAAPFLLVVIQPDLGTALLMIPVFFAMLLLGGARVKYIVIIMALGFLAMPFFWHFLRDYQRQRLLVFLNPNIDPLGAGYTIIQSKIAIGSGGLIGKGWLAGTQNQLNFLPERHTDFIFSVIGEEWGFLGALTLVLLYFLMVKRALTIASSTSDIYGKLIANGIAVLFSFQVVVNISMTIGLMPVVGIPLPLVSYGGSSLIATFAAIGLLINIGMRRSTF